MKYFSKKLRDGVMVSRGPADPSPPLTRVRQPGPDPAGPELTRPRLGPQPFDCGGLWTSHPAPAPAVDGASTAFGRDLVDGGGHPAPKRMKNIAIIN